MMPSIVLLYSFIWRDSINQSQTRQVSDCRGFIYMSVKLTDPNAA